MRRVATGALLMAICLGLAVLVQLIWYAVTVLILKGAAPSFQWSAIWVWFLRVGYSSTSLLFLLGCVAIWLISSVAGEKTKTGKPSAAFITLRIAAITGALCHLTWLAYLFIPNIRLIALRPLEMVTRVAVVSSLVAVIGLANVIGRRIAAESICMQMKWLAFCLLVTYGASLIIIDVYTSPIAPAWMLWQPWRMYRDLSLIGLFAWGVAVMLRLHFTLRRSVQQGCCPGCGYDLRGQMAGGCPECGWKR